jgi:vacuolar-type H+-ATPase subunit H
VDTEGYGFSVAEVRRMMIGIFNKLKEYLKEDIQKQLNECQKKMDKILKKAQKQLNELKEDYNRVNMVEIGTSICK